MKKVLLMATALLILQGWHISKPPGQGPCAYQSIPCVDNLPDSVVFTLRKGDILVRPNWSWLPGSFPLEGGRKFGHAAVVTEDMSGRTIGEVLEKTPVIEALFYDQVTGRFVFRKEGQIRQGKAWMSFGNKFKGLRYRLRTNLSDVEKDSLIRFLETQLGEGYNFFSSKRDDSGEKQNIVQTPENAGWHCATLIWEAYYRAAGIDLDSNKGWLIYPSDMIASQNFDLPDGRIRF
jgi:hypothetical protein